MISEFLTNHFYTFKTGILVNSYVAAFKLSPFVYFQMEYFQFHFQLSISIG